MWRSRPTCSTAPGRRTLTITAVPSGSVAVCAWPIDAAASGTGVQLGEDLIRRTAELGLDDALHDPG